MILKMVPESRPSIDQVIEECEATSAPATFLAWDGIAPVHGQQKNKVIVQRVRGIVDLWYRERYTTQLSVKRAYTSRKTKLFRTV